MDVILVAVRVSENANNFRNKKTTKKNIENRENTEVVTQFESKRMSYGHFIKLYNVNFKPYWWVKLFEQTNVPENKHNWRILFGIFCILNVRKLTEGQSFFFLFPYGFCFSRLINLIYFFIYVFIFYKSKTVFSVVCFVMN